MCWGACGQHAPQRCARPAAEWRDDQAHREPEPRKCKTEMKAKNQRQTIRIQHPAAPSRESLSETVARTARVLRELMPAPEPQGVMVVAAPGDKRLAAENETLRAEVEALRSAESALKAERQARYNAAAQWLVNDQRAAWRVKWEAHRLAMEAAERGYHHTSTLVAITGQSIGILDRLR